MLNNGILQKKGNTNAFEISFHCENMTEIDCPVVFHNYIVMKISQYVIYVSQKGNIVLLNCSVESKFE